MEEPVGHGKIHSIVRLYRLTLAARKPATRGQFTLPGQGMAGTVVDVGANVTRFRPGQRVMA